MSLNKWQGIGRLVADPRAGESGSGTKWASFRMAVDSDFKRDGEDNTLFIDVSVFGKTAENVARFLGKGRLVYVEGRLEIQQFEHEGVQRTKPQIFGQTVQFLDRGDSAPSDSGGSQGVGVQNVTPPTVPF